MTAYSQPKWFLMSMKIDTRSTSQEGIDLPSCIQKIYDIICSYSDGAECIYKWKVTGEPRIIAVIEVTNVMRLEKTLSGLADVGFVHVTSCQPLVLIEHDTHREGHSSTHSLADVKQLYWLKLTVECPDKYTNKEKLINILAKEATIAFGGRPRRRLYKFYKVLAERKIHMFVDLQATEIEYGLFDLPVFKEYGDNVNVSSRALHNLDDYIKSSRL